MRLVEHPGFFHTSSREGPLTCCNAQPLHLTRAASWASLPPPDGRRTWRSSPQGRPGWMWAHGSFLRTDSKWLLAAWILRSEPAAMVLIRGGAGFSGAHRGPHSCSVVIARAGDRGEGRAEETLLSERPRHRCVCRCRNIKQYLHRHFGSLSLFLSLARSPSVISFPLLMSSPRRPTCFLSLGSSLPALRWRVWAEVCLHSVATLCNSDRHVTRLSDRLQRRR